MNASVQNVNDDLTSLRVLEEIERAPDISQRELSRRLGVSLGLTNLLVRRMVRKAWIKIRSVPGRRLLYALTPKGLAEKFRKTRDFLRLSLRYYGHLKETIALRLRETKIPNPAVALVGSGELTELVTEAVREAGGRTVDRNPQIVLLLEKSRQEERPGVVVIDLT